MIGRPQPLNTLEQKMPSFEPRISKAIRIQRVKLLPCVQQFIKTSCVLPQGICKGKLPAVLVFLVHNILKKKRIVTIFNVYF